MHFGGRDRRPRSSEVADALQRPSSSEFGDALGGHDRATLEEYQEAVNLEAVSSGGRRDGSGETLFIG